MHPAEKLKFPINVHICMAFVGSFIKIVYYLIEFFLEISSGIFGIFYELRLVVIDLVQFGGAMIFVRDSKRIIVTVELFDEFFFFFCDNFCVEASVYLRPELF